MALPVGGASADPLDLSDPHPRLVQMSLESSPSHLPARLDFQYGDLAPAWLEPGPGRDQVTIRVAGQAMERLLRNVEPVPGSFSDFVWVIERSTGHVVSARVTGTLWQEVDFGLMETRVQTGIDAHMSTRSAAGFLPPYSRLGHVVYEHCAPSHGDCNLVPARAFDPYTGYVNAVGKIVVKALGGLTTETFSPLGEAVFIEMRSDPAVSAR